jgi:hypothetical protein
MECKVERTKFGRDSSIGILGRFGHDLGIRMNIDQMDMCR